MKLEKILKKYSVEDLHMSLSYLGLYSQEGTKKEDLINIILNYCLNFDNFKKMLNILPEYSFNKIVDEKVYECKLSDDLKLFNELKVFSIGFGDTETVSLPDEYIEFLALVDNAEEKKYRTKQLWFYACINFANTFYGIYNLEILEKLVKINTKLHFSNTEIKTRLMDLPNSVGINYYLEANAIVNVAYSDSLKDILERQESKPYYIPKYNEVMEYFNKGYISNIYYDLLENYNKYLKDEYGQEFKIILFNELATTFRVDEQLIHTYYDNTKVESIEKWNELVNDFNKVISTTRNLYNRGLSTSELMSRKVN